MSSRGYVDFRLLKNESRQKAGPKEIHLSVSVMKQWTLRSTVQTH